MSLPPYSEDAWARREDGEEKRASYRASTDVIRKVSALLPSHSPLVKQPTGNLHGDDAGNAQQQEQQLEQGVSPAAY